MIKRFWLILTIIILAILILGGVFFIQQRGKKAQKPVGEAAALVSAIVQITKDGFVPATLSVKKGTVVSFINNDTSPHRVSSNPHPTHTDLEGFDSQDNIDPEDTYSFIFEETGTFGYHDHLNPTTNGTVIVVE